MAGEVSGGREPIWFVLMTILILCLPAVTYGQRMAKFKATIHHIEDDFPISDLSNREWKSAVALPIAKYWDGREAPAGRRSDARLLWSASALYMRFDAVQTEPLVVSDKPQLAKKTMRLWDRDVCELFLAPDARNRRRYFEFEVAPTGEWLDLIVDWMKDEPRDWEYISSMEATARIEAGKVSMVMKIPWTAFAKKPEVGDAWLGNLFRQVGSGETRGYLAWSPTMTAEPQFHVPEKFGEFIFER